jgi:hypothetical protein
MTIRISLMNRSALLLLITIFFVACNVSQTDSEAGFSETSSALTSCGFQCPSGFHPTRYSYSSSCCSSFGCGLQNNSVSCEPDSGSSFETCGTACPSAYHPRRYAADIFNCCPFGNCSLTTMNSTICESSMGPSFQTCGLQCPSEYHPTSYSSDPFNCCVTSPCGLFTNSAYCTANPASLTASSNPVVIPANNQSTTFTLYWNAPGYSQVDLWGVQNLENPGQWLFLGSGPNSGSAPEPITIGEIATLKLYPHGNTTVLPSGPPLATLVMTATR